jgi:DHA2 family multidrug resistance protein
MFALGFVLYASTTAMPLFMQTLLGYTATQSGLALSPGGLVIMFMMPVVGMLLSRIQAKWLIIFGLVVSSIGLLMMTRWTLGIAFNNAVIARMVQSLGLAFLFVPINTIAFHYIDRAKTSYATGIINLARNIGGSVGIAVFTTLLARRQQFHQHMLVSHLTPFDPSYQSTLQGIAGALLQRGIGAAEAAAKAQGMLYGMVQQQASMLAFIDVFYFMAITFLVLVPLMFFIKKVRPQKGQQVAAH